MTYNMLKSALFSPRDGQVCQFNMAAHIPERKRKRANGIDYL